MQHTSSVMVGSYHTECTKQSHSKSRSHVSHDQEALKLQREVNRLRRELRRRKCDRRSPSSPSNEGLRGSYDRSYQRRSRTPSSKSYSASSQYDKLEKGYNKRGKRPSHHTMGNDDISKAL